MFIRGINAEDVRQVLMTGEVIESYPEDPPYPSRLVLGFRGTRPMHVVAADIPEDRETVVITAYEPDPALWDAAFRRRRMT
jgi:hypothetical protein